jgi:polysaccharide export outer membrane protein
MITAMAERGDAMEEDLIRVTRELEDARQTIARLNGQILASESSPPPATRPEAVLIDISTEMAAMKPESDPSANEPTAERQGRWFGWLRGGAQEGAGTGAESLDPDVDVIGEVAYVLQPGDEIDLQVFREPDFSGMFRLSPEGTIRHPLMGTLMLAGLSIKQIETQLVDELAERYLVNPSVIVQIKSAQGSQIVILGEVRKPGVYPLIRGDRLTLLQAIANAGGFTELASPDRVRIVRNAGGERSTIRVRVSELLSGRGRQQDIPLEPDDVIMVPEVIF